MMIHYAIDVHLQYNKHSSSGAVASWKATWWKGNHYWYWWVDKGFNDALRLQQIHS